MEALQKLQKYFNPSDLKQNLVDPSNVLGVINFPNWNLSVAHPVSLKFLLNKMIFTMEEMLLGKILLRYISYDEQAYRLNKVI